MLFLSPLRGESKAAGPEARFLVPVTADKDIVEGNVIGPFDNIKDALKALKTTKV